MGFGNRGRVADRQLYRDVVTKLVGRFRRGDGQGNGRLSEAVRCQKPEGAEGED